MGRRRGRGKGGGGDREGLKDGSGKRSAVRNSVRREIDEGDEQTTDDIAPGSGRAKLRGEVTTEWP